MRAQSGILDTNYDRSELWYCQSQFKRATAIARRAERRKPAMARSTNSLASPVCPLHELAPDAAGGFAVVDPQQRRDVARFRQAERERLIAARLSLDASTRATLSSRIAAHLDTLLGDLRGVATSAWMPFRREPDLRPWMASAAARAAASRRPCHRARFASAVSSAGSKPVRLWSNASAPMVGPAASRRPADRRACWSGAGRLHGCPGRGNAGGLPSRHTTYGS